MKYWGVTRVQWFAEASLSQLPSTLLYLSPLTATVWPGASLARVDRSWKGWKKDRTGANKGGSSLPCPWMRAALTDNSHLANPAKSTFRFSSPVLSAFFLNWKLAVLVSKSLSTLSPPLWRPGEQWISLGKRERDLRPPAAEGRKGRIRKGRIRKVKKKKTSGQGQIRQRREAMAGSTKNGSPSVFLLH